MRMTMAVLGVLGSWLSILVLPWSSYSGGVPFVQFPFWELHVACLLAFHGWIVVRDRVARGFGIVAGCASIGSAILVGLHYDDYLALFPDATVVPLAIPSPGLGAPIAVVAAGITLAVMTTRKAAAQPV
jgi:hypothetical protein